MELIQGEGLTFHLTCVAAEERVVLSILTVPAQLWGERAQHSPESLGSSLSCCTCEMGKGDGVNTQSTGSPPWDESCSAVSSEETCWAVQSE